MFGCASAVCGFGGLGADNAPPGIGALNYYRAGTRFLWLAPTASVSAPIGVGGISLLFMDLAGDARNKLANALRSQAYNVQVVYGGGEALEVSGSQGIDRASALDIRNQITQAAEAAGFRLTRPVQFSVETPADSSWRVGAPGSDTQWGDRTPVEPKSIFSELGLDLTGDTSFVGGSIKNLMVYGAIGLLAYAVITRRR